MSQQRGQAKPALNRILESSSSSNIQLEDDIDKTYCSELENSDSVPLFNSDDLKPRSFCSSISKPMADTVDGPFSDDELCSRISEMKVKEKQKQQSPKKNSQFAETVVGSFIDDSDSEGEPSIVCARSNNKHKDTIIQSSSDDEDDFPVPIIDPRRIPRPSLPDTVIGFSETMSELSIVRRTLAAAKEEEEREHSEESESDEEDEVITVLDSEEDVDDDQRLRRDTNESFENCSSVLSSQRGKDSDTTVNRFFNNPPLIRSSAHFITHSVIQRHRNGPIEEVLKVTSVSADRLKIYPDVNGDESSIDENLELPETDDSEDDHELIPEIEQGTPEIEVAQQLLPSQNAQVVTSEEQTLTQSTSSSQTIIQNFNISAKININLKISMRELNDSSSSEASSSSSSASSSSDSQPPTPPKRTPRKATETSKAGQSSKKKDSTRKEKQAATPGSGKKNTPEAFQRRDDFRTPSKAEEVIIDEDLQNILNSQYGDSWKTPQLLRSCKSKSVRQDLRKSIYANNFDNCKF
jgi:hypothetical protein